MAIPGTVRAGDTITWSEARTVDLIGNPAGSDAWAATAYLRFNASAEALTVSGVARSDGGWDFTVSATTSAAMNSGQWFWQVVLTKASEVITLGAGSFTVQPSLSYSGSAAAFDGRSQAEKDLEAVSEAIRALIAKGARQYSIGSRSFTSIDLPQLMEREAQLKAIVNREKKAEKIAAGLGDPGNLFVRFG